MILSRVDLPQPDGPTAVRKSPAAMSRSTPSSALTSPRGPLNARRTPHNSMMLPEVIAHFRNSASNVLYSASADAPRPSNATVSCAILSVTSPLRRVERPVERLGVDLRIAMGDHRPDLRRRLGDDIGDRVPEPGDHLPDQVGMLLHHLRRGDEARHHERIDRGILPGGIVDPFDARPLADGETVVRDRDREAVDLAEPQRGQIDGFSIS